jgi:chromosome segregation ATPase
VVAIQQWESRCDTLYKKIEELESELKDYETSETFITLRDQLDIRTEERRKLQIAFDDKVKKEQKLIQDLQDSQQLCENLQHIRDERNNLLSGRRSMEDEIERLRSAISELERTHQDQNNQIQVMKDAQVSDCSALKKEREDNALLKEELKQLGDDFALLLGANEQDPFGFNAEKITSKAAIDIMEKERKEINSLRSSLGDLQEELNNSRQKEQDTHIKLSETLQRLESSENQISDQRSEIEILQFTLESEKQNYLQQRSEFEQRIRHLEKDFQGTNARYAKNVEKLRNELTSTKAERDRLIYALEESERINSTFVHHTSLLSENAGANNLETEVSKLQSEKAKLLMMVSKQASSNEKRICNARSGDISDTVSKSEFTSLQAQFENVSIEYDKAKIRNDELLSLVQDAKKLSYEKERLEHEVAALEQEKSLVESSFTQKLSSYQDSYAELEKRYIESETKLKELQEAQESGKVSLLVNDNESNKADSDSDHQGYIEELKGKLKQSKSLYQDLWTEHEDLLALLAQQDCEKRCLEEALVSSEGHEALDRVMASAQEKLKNELGVMM